MSDELKPVRKFLKIDVSYPKLCAYPEYEGKPYFAIKFIENGETIVGFGTYKIEVLSQYLRDYFILDRNELQPVRCGCGGEAHVLNPSYTHCKVVMCSRCGIRTPYMNTEAEAIEAWNKAMGERTAKVMGDDGYHWHACNDCDQKVEEEWDYCPFCGKRLEWDE